jgi:hypothetical protein
MKVGKKQKFEYTRFQQSSCDWWSQSPFLSFDVFKVHKMPYSFHSHSGQFCKHGYGLLEDVVKEAIRKGFHVYGLSEHMPRYSESELYPEEIEVKYL